MSDHKAYIRWKMSGESFSAGKYSREHSWAFDGGAHVPASASPSIVLAPYSNPDSVDPEEAFVASIASCHMLVFLHLASRAGFEVLSYEDAAVGLLTKNEAGVHWLSSVALSPRIAYGPDARPSREQEEGLHARAHHDCFIANSVKTEITVTAERPVEVEAASATEPPR